MKLKRILMVTAAMIFSVVNFSNSFYRTSDSAYATETESVHLHGDMNFDSRIDIADYLLLKDGILNGFSENQIQRISADMNEDGAADSMDILILQEYMLGIASDTPVKHFNITPDEDPDDTEIIDEPEYSLIPSSVYDANACTQSVGETKALLFFAEFSDAQYSDDKLSEEQLNQEFFGNGVTAYPFESLSAYIDRSSYGNMTLKGDAFYCRVNGSLSDYSSDQGREKLVMDIMDQFDDRLDYSDYDADHDGDIDLFSFTVPLDNASDEIKDFWYGATHTWYYNNYYSPDNVRISKYIGNDVMPYREDMYYLKQTILHELGHSMGLPDIYKYSSYDYEGLKGNAGFCRMDDSIGDYSVFSKLMLGWISEDKVQIYDRNAGGTQNFELVSSAVDGSCIMLPLRNWNKSFTDEYFLIEYVTADQNNYDVKNWFGGWWSEKNNTGIRIFHVNSKMYTDYWGRKDFMYNNYSDFYKGDDRERVLRLVNDEKKGFYKSGDRIHNLFAYDYDGYEIVDTGYNVSILDEQNGVFSISITLS